MFSSFRIQLLAERSDIWTDHFLDFLSIPLTNFRGIASNVVLNPSCQLFLDFLSIPLTNFRGIASNVILNPSCQLFLDFLSIPLTNYRGIASNVVLNPSCQLSLYHLHNSSCHSTLYLLSLVLLFSVPYIKLTADPVSSFRWYLGAVNIWKKVTFTSSCIAGLAQACWHPQVSSSFVFLCPFKCSAVDWRFALGSGIYGFIIR